MSWTAAAATQTSRPLNADLPLLASQAAVEIEALIAQKPIGSRAVQQLARVVEDSLGRPPGSDSTPGALDPVTLAVFARALSIQHSEKPLQTVADLVTEAWRISTTLQQTGQGLDSDAWRRMRSFCVALADCAASYFQSLKDLRPSHPYKR